MGIARAKGIYAIFSLRVLNKLHSPVSFDSSQDQVSLYIGRDTYSEDFKAENGMDQNSLLWKQTMSGIQPRESETGDVIFDVPPSAAANMTKNAAKGAGNLDFLNFSDGGDWANASSYGTIRLYH